MPATAEYPPSHPSPLISKAEAARRLGVNPHTVGDLVALLGISCKPIPGRRFGDGLDPYDLARLAERLRPAGA